MKKPLAIIAVALGIAAAPIGSALAHPVAVSVSTPAFGISIGVPLPGVYVPAPVVVAPPPLVVAPPVAVAPPPVVVAPPVPVYYPRPYYRARYHGHYHWDARHGYWVY
ncbi:MAG TPA: hypothetical protein VMG60_04110 [Burkholderiaceae bacterium]|nr:hypothetical protein [Burkholderiaceae bacterium]